MMVSNAKLKIADMLALVLVTLHASFVMEDHIQLMEYPTFQKQSPDTRVHIIMKLSQHYVDLRMVRLAKKMRN